MSRDDVMTVLCLEQDVPPAHLLALALSHVGPVSQLLITAVVVACAKMAIRTYGVNIFDHLLRRMLDSFSVIFECGRDVTE